MSKIKLAKEQVDEISEYLYKDLVKNVVRKMVTVNSEDDLNVLIYERMFEKLFHIYLSARRSALSEMTPLSLHDIVLEAFFDIGFA